MKSLLARFTLALLSISGCLCLCACGAPQKLALAKDSVTHFHQQLDAEQYSALYAAADPKLHDATTEENFVKLVQAVHKKLGSVQQSDLRNTNLSWYAGQGATVTLVYNTKFSSGSGTEQFVWHVSDNKASLYGYHINSDDLIEK